MPEPNRPNLALMSVGSTEETIEIAPGAAMRLLVYPGAGRWRVLHLHGGAFSGSGSGSGSGCGERAVAAALSAAGATVHSTDYPAGSAHPFPAALDAAYAVLERLAGSRGRQKLFVAGEEAGGNLAAALALMCRDRGRPKLAGQILLSPMLDPRLGTCSVRTMEAGVAGCKWAIGWHEYLRTPDKAAHPYAAPGLASRLTGLPPALVLTGPNDPMADEAITYAARLRQSGVIVFEGRVEVGDAWPDALQGPADPVPPWAAPVCAAARDFFKASLCGTRKHHC